MSANLGKPARLIWSLAKAGQQGTTSAANGNSGAWPTGQLAPTQQNNMMPVDLRDVEDVWLTAMCGGAAGTTPALTVSLNGFDDAGNAWQIIALAAINTARVGNGKQASAGLYGGSASAYAVLPQWGQVAWTVGGTTPSFSQVNIALFGR